MKIYLFYQASLKFGKRNPLYANGGESWLTGVNKEIQDKVEVKIEAC